MKTRILIIVSAIFLLAISYYGYDRYQKNRAIDSWSLVPNSAAWVYETADFVGVWNRVVETDVWKQLSQQKSWSRVEQGLSLIDSMSEKSGILDRLLRNNKALISAHVTGKTEFKFLFTIPLGGVGVESRVSEILERYGVINNATRRTRAYQGHNIEEFVSEGNLELAYLIQDGHLLISSSSLIIEDVIRNVLSEYQNSFKIDHSDLFLPPRLEGDEGNLYLSMEQSSKFLEVFMKPDTWVVSGAESLAGSLFLDMTIGNNSVLSSGFAMDKEGTLAASFSGQEPQPVSVKAYVPTRTALMAHLGVHEPINWYQTALSSGLIKPQSGQNVDGKAFIQLVDSELGLLVMESANPDEAGRVLYVNTKDSEGMFNYLNRVSEAAALANDDSLYFEQYSDYRLQLLDVKEFPASILGTAFLGFESTVYTKIGQFFLLANSAETLKTMIADLEAEATWGKSRVVNNFLTESLDEANFTLVVNTERYLNRLPAEIQESVEEDLAQGTLTIGSFNMVAMQMSRLDNMVYTNMSSSFKMPVVVEGVQPEIDHQVILDTLVNYKPKVVRNHNNGSWETLLMDAGHNLSLVDVSGQINWTVPFNEPIVSQIHQIDYYNNRKLQYLFATAGHLHLIDRKGRAVDGFPIAMPEGASIQELFVLDYDRTKRYRFLVSDQQGNLRMFDKTGKSLDRWSPKAFNTELTDDVFHLRVRANDRIVVGLQNGNIVVTNRRGEFSNGFPLKLDAPLSSKIYYEIGSNFKTTVFKTVSSEGLVSTFNLEGDLINRNQLYAPNTSTKFDLIEAPGANDFIYTRVDLNRVAVLNNKGEILFEKDYKTAGPKEIQYYNFGSGKSFIAITDMESGKLYLYNLSGKSLLYPSLDNSYPVSLTYSEARNECSLYTAHDGIFTIWKLPIN